MSEEIDNPPVPENMRIARSLGALKALVERLDDVQLAPVLSSVQSIVDLDAAYPGLAPGRQRLIGWLEASEFPGWDPHWDMINQRVLAFVRLQEEGYLRPFASADSALPETLRADWSALRAADLSPDNLRHPFKDVEEPIADTLPPLVSVLSASPSASSREPHLRIASLLEEKTADHLQWITQDFRYLIPEEQNQGYGPDADKQLLLNWLKGTDRAGEMPRAAFFDRIVVFASLFETNSRDLLSSLSEDDAQSKIHKLKSGELNVTDLIPDFVAESDEDLKAVKATLIEQIESTIEFGAVAKALGEDWETLKAAELTDSGLRAWCAERVPPLAA